MTQVGAAALQPAAAPLVETKLIPLRARPQLVGRPRLLQALDRLDGTELTLVSAPAGGGKSVLVGSWCEAHPETAVAWVSLDQADNDPVRLWTYVATAVDRVRPGLGGPALRRLHNSVAGVTAGLDELLNGMAGHREPIAVVLDDLHAIQDEPVLRSFEYAIERLPPRTRVIATTRIDPRIRLGRLRARRALGELRARELAFTLEEARELLVVQEGIALGDDDLAVLVERSEGWPAGLYLAALWLRDHPDPGAGVREFTGDHTHVAEYLSGEVIDALGDSTRHFLVRTSVLARLSAPLCDALLETTGSQRILEELARSNLFLVPLDGRGQWFRCHHLFGELLRMELTRTEPEVVAGLHRRACAWCRGEGLVGEALDHAAAAGDDSVVAEILLEHHARLLRTGRSATLLRWVERLGTQTLVDHPELPAAGAIASGLLSRSASERARLLQLADRSLAEHPERSSPYVESAVSLARSAWIDGDTGGAVANGRRAAELGRTNGHETAVAALAALAFALFVQGDLEEARVVAQEAVDRPDAPDRQHGVVYANATLALLELELGRPRAAEAHAQRALETADAAGLARSWTAGLAHTALGSALAALGDLGRAEREAERGEALRRGPEPSVESVHARLILAQVRVARRRLAAASADLERAAEALAGFEDPGRLPVLAGGVAAALETAKGSAPALAEEPSPSEFAVLRLLATDLTQRQIGQQLYLSLNTVKTHTRGIYRKLGATSRQEAVAHAETLGLIENGNDASV